LFFGFHDGQEGEIEINTFKKLANKTLKANKSVWAENNRQKIDEKQSGDGPIERMRWGPEKFRNVHESPLPERHWEGVGLFILDLKQ